MRKYQLPIFTDHHLLSLLRERDDFNAFEEIYQRYWRKLLDSAFQRLKSKEAAEEVVQEVMVSLFLKRHELVITSSLEAWLKTALKYKVFNIYRSQQVHLAHLDEIIRQKQISPLRPDEEMILKEIRDKIKSAALKLPDKCREAFLLSRFEHLSQQEIADRMGISVSTVKKHLTRAFAYLRSELRENQIDLLAICFFVVFAGQL
ncbi:RNA polymerase sigma-70 factor [Mucilaginibacter sp. cycad4]|uniref:RNA polymerase sigma-70 factor n=1 Tax=Mucilaginibacter sp. cycad4 TaxID=3342096 RepID=UPI002AAA62AB|nr:RNA polymerase sigma-70 factor [Mucilaginibacter gossypii]WPU99038.1 RNA polymerase sigma-70 factor [Mucilaginibacter gossypii]